MTSIDVAINPTDLAHTNVVLDVKNLTAGYTGHPAINDINIHVNAGEVVSVLGANGAGKTTLLSTIMGTLKPMSGEVILNGTPCSKLNATARAQSGIRIVPEGRRLFPSLSARENIMSACLFKDRARQTQAVDEAIALFAPLERIIDRRAELLSGGEQQMVAIGRALAGDPEVLLLDEPSLGLAPLVVHDVFNAIETLAAGGLTILMVEQNAMAALRLSHRGYVIDRGRIVQSGTGAELREDENIRHAYLSDGS